MKVFIVRRVMELGLGNKGTDFEERTARKLRALGYTILARNRKICGVEIDIIALKTYDAEEHYFFIECKYRRKGHEYPLVSRRQQQRYQKAAAHWQAELGVFLNLHMTLAIPASDGHSIQILCDYF